MADSDSSAGKPAPHRWRFHRRGGVLQVILDRGVDLERLDDLDLKFWLALAMPTTGIEFDPKTAELLDTDQDQRIRPPEVLAAVKWGRATLNDTDLLLTEGDTIPLAAISDAGIAASARRILQDLGRGDATAISLADVADRGRILAAARFNGDGVIPPESAGDDETRKAITDIAGAMGSVTDRGGKPGLDKALIEAFFTQAAAHVAWSDRAAAEADIAPLGLDGTAAAAAAVQNVRAKVEDYFARCRLVAFDPTAAGAVNRTEAEFRAIAGGDLTAGAESIAAMPLAPAAGGRPLPLVTERVNPAWAAAIAVLREKAIIPLLGERDELTESEWREALGRLTAWDAWRTAKPAMAVEAFGLPRLRELLAGDLKGRLLDLVAKDLEPSAEFARVAEVEKLVRLRRDLRTLLANFVNFDRFYGRGEAVFQSGTLYLDGRACRLCVDVADAAKHAALAGFSGAYLTYCDIMRPVGQKKCIVAVFTDGDSDNLMIGRNGVFYDRQGRDWDATVTRIVANPISIREAFFLPYKRLVRMIEEQFAKRAQAADAAVTAKLGDTATQVAGAGQPVAAHAPPAAPKKIELGTIALIGTAIGGISALVGGLLQSLFGLGWWLPVGLFGIVLLISGPSMLLAALKLRRRNLGPILDSNGWAINTQARLNVAFGAALTELAVPPLGSVIPSPDPFADKRKVRPAFIVLLVLAILAAVFARQLAGWFV